MKLLYKSIKSKNTNKMKNIYITIGLLMMIFALNAQSSYYYYKGQKIYLTLDKSKINIIAPNNFQESSLQSLSVKNINMSSYNSENMTQKIGELEFVTTSNITEFTQRVNSIRQSAMGINVAYYYQIDASTSIGTSSIFYVKLKKASDYSVLQQIAGQKRVQIVKQVPYMPLWYRLSSYQNFTYSSTELSNQFYETGYFADVDPAFMFNFQPSCANDPSFGNLWGLKNNAFHGIDINICKAWEISQGEGINVAVVDTDIDRTHNDLSQNIHQLNLVTSEIPTEVSAVSHGTMVAGVVGAVKDNNLQVVGVAPMSKIMCVTSHVLFTVPTLSEELASGISWSWQKGADVINNSWGDKGRTDAYNVLHTAILEESITNAMSLGRNGRGTVVVFASGNNKHVNYPGTFHPDIMLVGAIGYDGYRWTDPAGGSGIGFELDIVAPGSGIISTSPGNETATESGTSLAAPHVSGICALILAVNPCLTGQEVRDIIEKTAKKIKLDIYRYSYTSGKPNGPWCDQMGYGMVNAYDAVTMAKNQNTNSLDLYVRDSAEDGGSEPNSSTQYMWTSDDVWIRNFDDGGLTHQNPDYNNGKANYVYVRVRNNSCISSNGDATDKLRLYWSKAGTSLSWPKSWDGTYSQNGIAMGKPIGALNIPKVMPGQEVILKFPWNVPNPNNYTSINAEPWHFCLLARIESTRDPMTYSETADLNANVTNNNNIAWKNVTIINSNGNNTGGTIAVGNPYSIARSFYLELVKEDTEEGKSIFEEAEVGLKMDQILYNAWRSGGSQSVAFSSTTDVKKRTVSSNNAVLGNIRLNPGEMGTLSFSFNFLANQVSDKTTYTYHVIQRDALSDKVVGGETYIINKSTRHPFTADAGESVIVDKWQPVTLSASPITEPAIYNWYDSSGNLICEGENLTVSVDKNSIYKLEVISVTDGFKDYAEVQVKLKPSVLEGISPNPSYNNVTISYKLNSAKSAHLMIAGYYCGNQIINNYLVDLESKEININLSTYQQGFYTVSLICDGEVVGTQTLIKQ